MMAWRESRRTVSSSFSAEWLEDEMGMGTEIRTGCFDEALVVCGC